MSSPVAKKISSSAILVAVFVFSAFSSTATHPVSPYGSCQKKCGSMPVNYPFGTGSGCGHPDFAGNINCNSGTLELSIGTGTYAILSIDYEGGTLVVSDPLMSTCSSMQNTGSFSLERSSPFALTADNVFALIGCSTTSPVFDLDEGLCATGSVSRVCRALYSCKGVTGIGLWQNAPSSSCCVYQSPIELGGFKLDLPKLQCSSYTSIYSFGSDKGNPTKWEFGISLMYNNSYSSDECKDCAASGGICGFDVSNHSFRCLCPNGKNSTNNCLGRGFEASGGEEMRRNQLRYIFRGLVLLLSWLPLAA